MREAAHREAVVVGTDGVAHRWTELASAACALAEELPRATPGSHIVLAFDRDRPGFLIGMFAAWRRGHEVALPADARRASVAPLLELPEVCGLIHDSDAGAGFRASPRPDHALELGHGEQPADLGPITHCTVSQGGVVARAAVPADRLQQRVEIAAREMQMPRGATLVVTPEAGHGPALVAGVLLPLALGARSFGASGCTDAELWSRIDEWRATDLLTSPDVARRLARSLAGSVRALERLHVLGYLDAPSRARLRAVHGLEPRILEAARMPEPEEARALDALFALPQVEDAEIACCPPRSEPATPWCVACSGEGLSGERIAELVVEAAGLCATPRVACLDRLPRDASGVIPAAFVLRACGFRGDGALPNRHLDWSAASSTEKSSTEKTWTCRVLVPADYDAFDGHFDGFPVLSGAAQLHDLVVPALRRALAAEVVGAEWKDLKFHARIEPGAEVEVSFALGPERADFALKIRTKPCTTGRVLWKDAARSR